MQSMGRWADAAGHPSGAALAAAGYVGVIVYAGTPGRPKNITKPVYDDYVAHGLQIAAVYEDGLHDIASGQGTGHAHALMADLLAIGAPNTLPIAAAADEHLTAAQVQTAIGYQTDFYRACKAAAWVGPAGGYGFSEYTRAVSAAGVADWLWQAGSASALWSGVTFWQRNDGQPYVGGAQIDINEQYLPLATPAPAPNINPGTPQEDDMITAPAGTDEHIDLIVAGKTQLYIGCSWGQYVDLAGLLFFGKTGAVIDAAPANFTGFEATPEQMFRIDDGRPGPLGIPAGAVTATIRYTAAHSFAVGAA